MKLLLILFTKNNTREKQFKDPSSMSRDQTYVQPDDKVRQNQRRMYARYLSICNWKTLQDPFQDCECLSIRNHRSIYGNAEPFNCTYLDDFPLLPAASHPAVDGTPDDKRLHRINDRLRCDPNLLPAQKSTPPIGEIESSGTYRISVVRRHSQRRETRIRILSRKRVPDFPFVEKGYEDTVPLIGVRSLARSGVLCDGCLFQTDQSLPQQGRWGRVGKTYVQRTNQERHCFFAERRDMTTGIVFPRGTRGVGE